MKVTIQAERALDVSVMPLEINTSGKNRIVLTFGDVLEVAVGHDELINALLALDGTYTVDSLRHEFRRSTY